MKRDELKIDMGGVYRCCMESALLWVKQNPKAEVKPGDKVQCIFERGGPERMQVDDLGVIRALLNDE
jgi:hypothetical protein